MGPRGIGQNLLNVFEVPLLVRLAFPDVVRVGDEDKKNHGEAYESCAFHKNLPRQLRLCPS
jgi:hypothetical protein